MRMVAYLESDKGFGSVGLFYSVYLVHEGLTACLN